MRILGALALYFQRTMYFRTFGQLSQTPGQDCGGHLAG
jgi:hypothetical protein